MKCIKYACAVMMVLLCLVMPRHISAEDAVFDTVKIYFSGSDIPTIVEGDVVMNLYSEDGSVLLDTKTYEMKRGYAPFEIEFNVPEYKIGTKFRFAVSDAVESAYHDGTYSREHIIETYVTADENNLAQYCTDFYMDLCPMWNREAIIKIPAVKKTLFYHFLIGDEVYVTTDLFDALGIQCRENPETEKSGFTLSCGGYTAKFYYDDIYASFGGKGENLSTPAFKTDGLPYAPLSKIATYFACNYNVVVDNAFCKEITLTISNYSDEYKSAAYVNGLELSSRMDYLVWVSKKDYTVNVYMGADKSWRLIKSFPCAIGAPDTPTIEGLFEYYQYQTKWQYDGYYCGPIMRFKDGYALHSTLIRDDGRPYDGRVGMKISHGCVRMKPDDIRWMVSYVPLYSKIFVTK